MSARSLGQDILSAMPPPQSYGPDTPTIISTMVAQKLTSYIIANTSLIGVYNGVIPGTPPIPEVSIPDTWSVVGNIAPAVTSSAGPNVWLMQLDNNIRIGILTASGAYCNPMSPVPAFPAISTMLQQSEIAAYGNKSSSVATDIWELVLTRIFTAIKMGFIPTVPAMSNVGGAGVFTITSVILN
jgi:hypothetical protein